VGVIYWLNQPTFNVFTYLIVLQAQERVFDLEEENAKLRRRIDVEMTNEVGHFLKFHITC
jgi:hypothetical protein